MTRCSSVVKRICSQLSLVSRFIPRVYHLLFICQAFLLYFFFWREWDKLVGVINAVHNSTIGVGADRIAVLWSFIPIFLVAFPASYCIYFCHFIRNSFSQKGQQTLPK